MSRHLVVFNERDPEHPQAGGAEVHFREVFRRLVAGGDRVTLLASGFAGARALETQDGITVHRLGTRYSYYARLPGAYRRLRRAEPVDAVVEDLNKFPVFARFWVREPLLVLAHHLFGATAFRQVPWPVAAATVAAEWLVPRLYRGVPVVAVSPSTRDELVARGLAPHDVQVIPNGVDETRYRPGGGARAAEPTILVLGRVEPYKRVDLIVDALALLPEARLVVAGSGTGATALRAHVVRRGLAARVELRGFVDEAEKVRLLQQAHVVASASEKEGWGLTVLEAAACGTPAVVRDAPGLRDAVRDGETGLFVREASAQAFAEVLGRVLADDGLRARLATEAIRYAARFRWDAIAADVSAAIDAARGTAPARPAVVGA